MHRLHVVPLVLAMLLSACCDCDDGVSPKEDALIGTWELVEVDGHVPRTAATWRFTATTVEFPDTGQCVVVNTYTRLGNTLRLTVIERRGKGCSGFDVGVVTQFEATVSGDTLAIVWPAFVDGETLVFTRV
jgi:hypothetical protein